MLAGQSPEQARATLQLHALRRMTPATCLDVDLVSAEIARAREQGWAQTEGEHIEGASDIAVPVYGVNRLVVAEISLGAPSHVFGPERRREVLPHLLRAAEQTHLALVGPRTGWGNQRRKEKAPFRVQAREWCSELPLGLEMIEASHHPAGDERAPGASLMVLRPRCVCERKMPLRQRGGCAPPLAEVPAPGRSGGVVAAHAMHAGSGWRR